LRPELVSGGAWRQQQASLHPELVSGGARRLPSQIWHVRIDALREQWCADAKFGMKAAVHPRSPAPHAATTAAVHPRSPAPHASTTS